MILLSPGVSMAPLSGMQGADGQVCEGVARKDGGRGGGGEGAQGCCGPGVGPVGGACSALAPAHTCTRTCRVRVPTAVRVQGGAPGEGAGRNLLNSVRMMTLSFAGSASQPTSEGGISRAPTTVTRHRLELACRGVCPSVLASPGTQPGIWPLVGQPSKAMAGLSAHGRQGGMASRAEATA